MWSFIMFWYINMWSQTKKKKRNKERTINEGKPIRRKKRERKKENTREKKDIVWWVSMVIDFKFVEVVKVLKMEFKVWLKWVND